MSHRWLRLADLGHQPVEVRAEINHPSDEGLAIGPHDHVEQAQRDPHGDQLRLQLRSGYSQVLKEGLDPFVALDRLTPHVADDVLRIGIADPRQALRPQLPAVPLIQFGRGFYWRKSLSESRPRRQRLAQAALVKLRSPARRLLKPLGTQG